MRNKKQLYAKYSVLSEDIYSKYLLMNTFRGKSKYRTSCLLGSLGGWSYAMLVREIDESALASIIFASGNSAAVLNAWSQPTICSMVYYLVS